MKRCVVHCLGVAFFAIAAFFAVAVIVITFGPKPAAAQVGKGQSDHHYNFSVIGVPNSNGCGSIATVP